jgi:hypothetical protein
MLKVGSRGLPLRQIVARQARGPFIALAVKRLLDVTIATTYSLRMAPIGSAAGRVGDGSHIPNGSRR